MLERIIELPPDRAATLVVVADTHSKPDARALPLIHELAPDALLHAGDIGDLGVLQMLAPLAPQLVVVRGNIDTAVPDIPEMVTIALHRRGTEVLRLLLMHIAVYGPRLLGPARRAALEARAEVVVCGHSHVPFITRDDSLAVFNPGSIGPRRFGLPIVFGVMHIDARLSFRHVDCETGQTWTPAVNPTARRRGA